jgi:hypothetical protein
VSVCIYIIHNWVSHQRGATPLFVATARGHIDILDLIFHRTRNTAEEVEKNKVKRIYIHTYIHTNHIFMHCMYVCMYAC